MKFVRGFVCVFRDVIVCVACVPPAQTEKGNGVSYMARMGFKLTFVCAVFFLCVFGGEGIACVA
jgi:hypothetical protein